MAKKPNRICNLCSKRKSAPNLDCKGSGVVHPLPAPLSPKPSEST